MTTPLVQSITDEMVAELEFDLEIAETTYAMEASVSRYTLAALLAELKELVSDRERLDWLADPDNTIGNVQLPLKCVTANVHSLRDAIDAARGEV